MLQFLLVETADRSYNGEELAALRWLQSEPAVSKGM